MGNIDMPSLMETIYQRDADTRRAGGGDYAGALGGYGNNRQQRYNQGLQQEENLISEDKANIIRQLRMQAQGINPQQQQIQPQQQSGGIMGALNSLFGRQ